MWCKYLQTLITFTSLMALLQTLLPNQDMDVVDTMIENGMVMMRDSIATVCQEAALGSDVTTIQDTVVAFSPDWDRLLMQLNFGVAETAYDRYHSWYNSSPWDLPATTLCNIITMLQSQINCYPVLVPPPVWRQVVRVYVMHHVWIVTVTSEARAPTSQSQVLWHQYPIHVSVSIDLLSYRGLPQDRCRMSPR